MFLPPEYVDETCGVHGATKDGFNNIVYLTWYLINRKISGKLNESDMKALNKHISMNRDEHGLYVPKNSHDNITYKMILNEEFNLKEEMSFFRAAWDAGIYRIWDVIMYGSVFSPPPLRPVFQLFLIIPALQCLWAIHEEGKTRPKWYEPKDVKNSRILWWFKREELLSSTTIGSTLYQTWILKDGTTRVSRDMQNDGKHLAIFRLYAFKDRFWVFNQTAKIARKMLIKKFGSDYTKEVIDIHLNKTSHPVTDMWEDKGDIL